MKLRMFGVRMTGLACAAAIAFGSACLAAAEDDDVKFPMKWDMSEGKRIAYELREGPGIDTKDGRLNPAVSTSLLAEGKVEDRAIEAWVDDRAKDVKGLSATNMVCMLGTERERLAVVFVPQKDGSYTGAPTTKAFLSSAGEVGPYYLGGQMPSMMQFWFSTPPGDVAVGDTWRSNISPATVVSGTAVCDTAVRLSRNTVARVEKQADGEVVLSVTMLFAEHASVVDQHPAVRTVAKHRDDVGYSMVAVGDFLVKSGCWRRLRGVYRAERIRDRGDGTKEILERAFELKLCEEPPSRQAIEEYLGLPALENQIEAERGKADREPAPSNNGKALSGKPTAP